MRALIRLSCALALTLSLSCALGGCTVMSDLGRFQEFVDIDAGPDAGPPETDAGSLDASNDDAGASSDAGAPADASVVDAGT